MGAIPHPRGVAFRVWAPHAEEVCVIGSFNNWDRRAHALHPEGNGHWYLDVPEASPGDEYRFALRNNEKWLLRIDPYAREVTNSVGNGVVYDSAFDWEGDAFSLPPFNELVVYEMHVGTFGRSRENAKAAAEFDDIERQFDHLTRLGVNVIQLMPVAEFAGDVSWGYNPAHIFSVESAYGGPRQLKEFVKQAHRRSLGVVLDVVYNHFGPSDLDLWQFDGWSEDGLGGIYFYNDWRAKTPWGDTRPDYGRGEVRQFIHDNALMWLDEFHVDGLRYDMTLFMHSVHGDGNRDIPDGWSLTQWINRDVAEKFPGRITIAEDLQNNDYLTRAEADGGANFDTQWDAGFVHPVRSVVQQTEDAARSMWTIRDALTHRYNQDAFERVIYTESHDEVANGRARVPEELDPDDASNWFAQKRSTLAAALMFTAPGIPMLFQGQEFLQGKWFDDNVPLDWDRAETYSGIVRLYRDLIRLRSNREGHSHGLTGQHINVHHINDGDKVIAYHRFADGGPGDDVVVLANFANRAWDDYTIGFPRPGKWVLRLNSDWKRYSSQFADHAAKDVLATSHQRDGCPASANLTCGPYSVLIYSQAAKGDTR
jgi:1,4-alpha-glucan branching enzyme